MGAKITTLRRAPHAPAGLALAPAAAPPAPAAAEGPPHRVHIQSRAAAGAAVGPLGRQGPVERRAVLLLLHRLLLLMLLHRPQVGWQATKVATRAVQAAGGARRLKARLAQARQRRLAPEFKLVLLMLHWANPAQGPGGRPAGAPAETEKPDLTRRALCGRFHNWGNRTRGTGTAKGGRAADKSNRAAARGG